MLGRIIQTFCVALVSVTLISPAVVTGQANRCFPGERLEFFSPSITRSVEQFGLPLFRQVASSKPHESVFISPYSIWSALVLAYYGSAGNTRAQLEDVLGLSSKTSTYSNWGALRLILEDNSDKGNARSSGARFKSLNRAYFSNRLAINDCLSTILPDIKKIDFTKSDAARATINRAVSETTEGKIPELLKFVDPNTRFALINAVFFKGKWENKFKTEKTGKHDFLVPPGVSGGLVDMMTQYGNFNYGYSQTLDASILELPYRQSSVSMFVMLPSNLQSPTTLDTQNILQRLTPETFSKAYRDMNPTLLHVGLPRFKLTTRIERELKEVLMTMGITDLFDPRHADLTDFAERPQFSVDQTIHEATIEVNEEGTVAAAATGLINTRIAGPQIFFFCNRPFVLLLTDKLRGITLFAANIVRASDLENLSPAKGQ